MWVEKDMYGDKKIPVPISALHMLPSKGLRAAQSVFLVSATSRHHSEDAKMKNEQICV